MGPEQIYVTLQDGLGQNILWLYRRSAQNREVQGGGTFSRAVKRAEKGQTLLSHDGEGEAVDTGWCGPSPLEVEASTARSALPSRGRTVSTASISFFGQLRKIAKSPPTATPPQGAHGPNQRLFPVLVVTIYLEN